MARTREIATTIRLLVLTVVLCAAGGVRAADTITFEVISPDKIDVAALPGRSLDQTIQIRSTGSTAIKNVALQAGQLTDAATMGRLDIAKTDLGACSSGLCSFTIALPQAMYAGTYTGALTLIADGVARQTLPVTIRSRGPNRIPGGRYFGGDEYLPRLPFVLFWVVTGVGTALSLILDAWFAGGGRRWAESQRLLAKARSLIVTALARAAAWQAAYGPGLTKNVTRWQLALGEIDDLEATGRDKSVDDYEKAVNAQAAIADASKVLVRAIDIATETTPDKANLLAVVTKLDQIDPTAGALDVYRAACLKTLQEAAGGGEHGASFRRGATIATGRLGTVGRLVWMDHLYVILGWLVIGLVAYLTFFDRAWSFGTARDYITLFLWTLGLTQTGTQIIARSKSSYPVTK